MQKWWSVLFGVVALGAVILFIVAPFVGWWMPRNVSSFGGQIDALFYLILGITGFFFILTESLLVYFLYTYAGRPDGSEHPVGHHYAESRVLWTTFFKRLAKPVTTVIHNQHRLELFWTLVPAVILLYIAFAQVHTWAEIKYPGNMPDPNGQPQQIEVSARQFEWRIRYPSLKRMKSWKPGADDPEKPELFARVVRPDDLHLVNEVHAWKGQKVLVHLSTRDVLHSFYFPNLRLKQDAVPGKVIPVWFAAVDFNTRPKYRSEERPPKEEEPWFPFEDPTNQGRRWVKWVDGYDPVKGDWGHEENIWELACAELCGWGHYKMQGKLFVHENEDDFRDWLAAAEKEQGRHTTPAQ